MIHIYGLTFNELINELESRKIAKFRASQIWDFLYVKKVDDFDQMHNIPNDLIKMLKENFSINESVEKVNQISFDKTQKSLLKLKDGHDIETVLMKYKHGNTVCVTTQIGCKIGCSFCASHLGGFIRNLTAGEIVEQILYWDKKLNKKNEKVDNVVVMGIGEPFDNLPNVFKFIDIINSEQGLNIGARKITVSTSGIMSKIDEFIDYPKQINLAISLHAPNDNTRTNIMKINKQYNINSILKGVEKYQNKKNRQVTFEYILLKDLNDSYEDAVDLANLAKNKNIHINLIPYNKVDEYDYKKTSDEKIKKFASIIEENKVSVSIRQQKGNDIDGACGQLRRKE